MNRSLSSMLFTFAGLITLICISLDAQTSNECKNELRQLLGDGKCLVLKVDGIPTMIEKMPGNLGAKSYCHIKVNEEGEWKVKSILGEQSDSTNVLSKGDILIIKSVDIGKDSIELNTKTEKAISYDAKGRTTWLGSTKSKGTGIHANRFVFKVNSAWNLEEIKIVLAKYFDIYNTKDEIGKAKEIKIGMNIDEVIKALGEPQKKADLGEGKIVFKFEDTIVTFQDSKVVNIEFR